MQWLRTSRDSRNPQVFPEWPLEIFYHHDGEHLPGLSLRHWYGSTWHHPSINQFECVSGVPFTPLLLCFNFFCWLVLYHLQCICLINAVAIPQASVAAMASSCLVWVSWSPFGMSSSNILRVKNRWGRVKPMYKCSKNNITLASKAVKSSLVIISKVHGKFQYVGE